MKKKEDINDYLTAHDAAHILSVNHTRPIRPDYISKMAHSRKHSIRVCQFGDRLMYNKADIAACQIGSRVTHVGSKSA